MDIAERLTGMRAQQLNDYNFPVSADVDGYTGFERTRNIAVASRRVIGRGEVDKGWDDRVKVSSTLDL